MATWTMQEFTAVLLLKTRSSGAVAAVRGGVDAWHRGMNHSMLNQIMVSYLSQTGRPRYRCARCGGQV